MNIPALFMDLYELTMAQACAAEHMEQPAVFELAFPNEAIVQAIAPILEAQLMETLILNQFAFPSLTVAI